MIFEELEIKQIEKIAKSVFSKIKEELREDNIITIPEAMEYLEIKSGITFKRLALDYGFNIYGLGKKRYCFKSEINAVIRKNIITK